MTTVIEAVYENGVLKPLAANDLKEHQRYRLSWEEAEPANGGASAAGELRLPAHLAHRLDVLPDGRRVIRFSGARAACLDDWPDDFDPIAVALEEIKQEQNRLREEEWDEFFPLEPRP
jgi:hypothetical protein